MKKLKDLLSVALCVCTLAFVAACGKVAPEDVAIKVMKSFRDGDGDAVKDNCTSEETQHLKLVRKQLKKVWEGASFKAAGTDTFGDEATVTVEIVLKGGIPEMAEVELTQDDGAWKVSNGAWPPGTVFGMVLEASFDGNTDVIDANCTANGARWHKEMAQLLSRPPNYSWKVQGTSIHGSEAEVTIEESGVDESYNETSSGKINLKKVNGAWKVDAGD